MTRTLILALTASAALAAPQAAQAQTANESSTVTLTASVQKVCVIGEPAQSTLTIGDLTGPDGRITATLAGSATAVSTSIDNAWCNTPSTLSLNGAPMALTVTPGYVTPNGFARLLTFDATLVGWPANIVDRPLVGDAAKTTSAATPHAASSLVLNISALEALNAGGTAANNGAVLEAGSYSGSVVIAVAAQ